MNSLIPLYEKTFGIKNKVWLEKSGRICMNLYTFLLLVLIYETIQNIFVMQIGFKNVKVSDAVVAFHLILYVLCGFIPSVLLDDFEDKQPDTRIKNFLIGVPASMVFIILYFFNPWIFYHQNNANTVYLWFNYSFICAKLLLLIFLTSSCFVTWILWKMRRFERDYVVLEVQNVAQEGEPPQFVFNSNNMQIVPRISSISVMNCMPCRKFSITCLTSFAIGICLAIYDRYQFTLKKTDSNFFLYYYIGFHLLSLSSYSIYLYTSYIPLQLSIYRKLVFVNASFQIFSFLIFFLFLDCHFNPPHYHLLQPIHSGLQIEKCQCWVIQI
ncbi:unnamed protein product [Caenorhabditis brenneri]